VTHVIAMRSFAILAAILLVGAFALATILPPDLALRDGLALLDTNLPGRLQAAAAAHLPTWMWNVLMLPVLLRPIWLVPAGLGMICAGAALTCASAGSAQRSRRRRS
jgi:hypothetical protein